MLPRRRRDVIGMRIALEQELAAEKMGKGEVASIFKLTHERHGLFDARKSPLRAQSFPPQGPLVAR